MKQSTHRILVMVVATCVVAGCGPTPPIPVNGARDQLLDQAFQIMPTDPVRAADLFAQAGPGPSLEEARMAAWAGCLRKIQASADSWRRYLGDHPPPQLAGTARLELIRKLVEMDAAVEAVAERGLMPDSLQPAADEALLSISDANQRLQAARRLVISSPKRLAAHDRKLERTLLASLSPEDRLARSRAWRSGGSPKTAAAELRSLKWRGPVEIERRRELAQAEIEAGSPLRALRVLPNGRDATAKDFVLRARAYRNRAWHLWPGRGEEKAFRDCLDAVGRTLAAGPSSEISESAHELGLECATETGRLDVALDSWRRLEGAGWKDSRREWLGRRLGVALALAGTSDRVAEIARALPAHERCLQFWMASTSTDRQASLESLSNAPVADLYAVWAREASGWARGGPAEFSPPVSPGAPPRSVGRLTDIGAPKEAARQWRRIRASRSTTPAEALAASTLAAASGLPTDSIRWLRAGFPSLGTVDVTRAPRNAVEAYLPIRWPDGLVAAARESGVDPWLLAGIARQESTFSAHAVSPRGAVGVVQLLPSTARVHSRALGLGSSPDLYDPAINFRLGARELSILLRKFGAVEPALAAYNAGETRVRSWWRLQPDRRRFTEEIPVPETYNYVRRVVYLSEAYRLLYGESWRNAQ